MAKERGSEQDLAKILISYMKHEGWDVFMEVPLGNSAADIVVTKGKVLGVIECKKNLGLDVIEQCHDWLKHANFVWAGVWYPKRDQTRFGAKVAKDYGIGVMWVNDSQDIDAWGINSVVEKSQPEFRRKTSGRLFSALRPEMQTGQYAVAGTNKGNRFTPFKQTCEELLGAVRANPSGIELKRAISQIRTHYASNTAARVNIKNHIEDGIIKGLTMVKENGKLILYPDVLKSVDG